MKLPFHVQTLFKKEKNNLKKKKNVVKLQLLRRSSLIVCMKFLWYAFYEKDVAEEIGLSSATMDVFLVIPLFWRAVVNKFWISLATCQ